MENESTEKRESKSFTYFSIIIDQPIAKTSQKKKFPLR